MCAGGRYLRCLALGVCLGSCAFWMIGPALNLAKAAKPEKKPKADSTPARTKAAATPKQLPPLASVRSQEKQTLPTQTCTASPYGVVAVTPPRKRPPSRQRRCAFLEPPLEIVDAPRLMPCPSTSRLIVLPAAYTVTKMSATITPCSATLAPPIEMGMPSCRAATLGLPIEVDDTDDACLTLPAFELFQR